MLALYSRSIISSRLPSCKALTNTSKEAIASMTQVSVLDLSHANRADESVWELIPGDVSRCCSVPFRRLPHRVKKLCLPTGINYLT